MSGPQDQGSAQGPETMAGAGGDRTGDDRPVTQAEIDDIVNDIHMPIEERVVRLKALTDRLGTPPDSGQDAESDPLLAQLSEAMNMLAEGGHVFGTGEASIVDRRTETGTFDDTVTKRAR